MNTIKRPSLSSLRKDYMRNHWTTMHEVINFYGQKPIEKVYAQIQKPIEKIEGKKEGI